MVCGTLNSMVMGSKIKIVLVVLGVVVFGVPLFIGFSVIGIFLFDSVSGSESVVREDVKGGEIVEEQGHSSATSVVGKYTESDTILATGTYKKPNFYYLQDGLVFKMGIDLEESDTLSYKSDENTYMYPSNKKNILFVEKGDAPDVVYTLDISKPSPTLQLLVTLPEPKRPDDLTISQEERFADGYSSKPFIKKSRVRFVDDGAALAYITSKCRYPGPGCGESVVHIISVPDGKEIEQYEIPGEIRLYDSPHFGAVSGDGKRLYVAHASEFGLVDYFDVVDRNTGTLRVLKSVLGDRVNIEDYYIYDFSPDAKRLATEDLSMKIADEDADWRDYGSTVCLDSKVPGVLEKYADLAGVILVRNLETDEVKEVYRNVVATDNYCKNQYNKIMSLQWLDDVRIAFVTQEGIYAINVNTKEKQTLFVFDKAHGAVERPEPLSIQMPYILFTDGSILNTRNRRWLKSEGKAKSYQEGRRLFAFE